MSCNKSGWEIIRSCFFISRCCSLHTKKLYYSLKIKTNDKDENMNEFAKLLSAFVKEKGVKIQPFARYCGYDRANMYKILKGQRNLPGIFL